MKRKKKTGQMDLKNMEMKIMFKVVKSHWVKFPRLEL